MVSCSIRYLHRSNTKSSAGYMADMDSPLDFESEDHLLTPVPEKKRKAIGLDDLLTDYYKEKVKHKAKIEQRKTDQGYNSDEDDKTRENLFSQYVDECQGKMEEFGGEDEISAWGIRLFGIQKTVPLLIFHEHGCCTLLQSFMNNELNSMVLLSTESAEDFLNGLLSNGWLQRVVFTRHHLEFFLATWTFHLLLYSSKQELMAGAIDLWCGVLSSESEVSIDWIPTHADLRAALDVYGFLFDTPFCKVAHNSDMETIDSCHGRPPQNIICWIKFIRSCSHARSKYSIFTASEAEELAVVVISLFLDRHLEGLLVLMNACLVSLIGYFTDNEWNSSCKGISKSLARNVYADLNCLKLLERISGMDARCRQLRSEIAYEVLAACLQDENAEEMLGLLISVNAKERNCDLFKLYICLVLSEYWLLYNFALKREKPVIYEFWAVYLRNCSLQITTTDSRPYALKVRTKARYLLQVMDWA